jgi:DNA-binding CsgD family transcriptional regulator
LTAREVEVARLVASGATNRQIAAHIEHIIAKLGAARRTEIATWITATKADGSA